MKNVRIILLIVFALAAAGIWGYAISSKPADENSDSKGDITLVATTEQTEIETPSYFVVEEYDPIIPDGTNIADLSRFDASGYNDVYLPGKAKDGKTAGASYWEAAADSYPNTLTAIFQESFNVHAVKLMLCPLPIWGTRIQTFSIEVSEDGENFKEIVASEDYTFDPKTDNEVVVEFDEVNMKSIRLIFTQNTGAVGAQVAEWEIYSNDDIASE